MKLLIINNLSSGYGDGAIYDFIRSFGSNGDEVCLRSANSSANFQSLLSDATDFDAVVASGGDGTVASVCYYLRNTGVPILPFPAGTANLLTLNLFSPTEPHALAKLAREGKVLDFDLGEITANGTTHGFSIIAGCGYDATIMKDAKATKKLLGPLSYFQAAAANPLPQKSHFKLTVDGVEHEFDGMGILLVNFSKIQMDIEVSGWNKPRDGLLDIVVLTSKTAFELLPILFAAAVDKSRNAMAESEALKVFHGKTISIEAEPAMNVQFDGETLDATTPFQAKVIEKAARLIVTDEAYDFFSSRD